MTDRGRRPGEGEAEQHEEWYDLTRRLDVGHTQAAVIAAVSGSHGLEHIRQLQEVQADHRRSQDGELPKK